MKVTMVEVGQFHELALIEDGDAAAMKVDDAVLPQLPDHAIGVHGGDPERLTDLLLRQRHVEALAGYASDDLETLAQLDHHMRKPRGRRALTDIDDPFTEHRGIDQRIAPEQFCNLRPAPVQLLERPM